MADMADQICQNDVPCIIKWNSKYNRDAPRASLTSIGNLSGTPSMDVDEGSAYAGNIQGAHFKPVHYKTPYYERMVVERVEAPWPKAAQFHERTFMNRIKEMNEPPVKDYKDLKLSSPDFEIDTYDKYVPTIYTEDMDLPERVGPNTCKEGFGSIIEPFPKAEGESRLIARTCIVIMVFLFLYFVLKRV